MSVIKNQSAIAEVRDQLSLDFADGEYLNVVSQNLGMDRPIIGFSDDVWRALVKQLALEYKQINTQFYKMMEIVFGVQITKAGSLAEAIDVGDNKCVLNDTSQFPQVGTMVFDEGLATEETHAYCYIDRHTNTVYLDGTTFAFAHIAYTSDSESAIICSNDTSFVVANASSFPTTDFPYTVVLGRGTDNEEINSVTACDPPTGLVTLGSSPANSHTNVVPTDTVDDLAQAVYLPTSSIQVDDTSKFPASGIIRLRPTNSFAVAADVTPTTNRVITVAADTFVEDSLVGFEIVMSSGTTDGRRRRIVANTASSITVDEDWVSLGSAPLTADTFSVFPIVDYTSNDVDNGILNLREMLDLDTSVTTWNIPNNSLIELMETKETVAFAPVKSPGQDWDIIQSTPGTVEILLPEELRSINNLRSASYIHTAYDNTDPATTLSANVTAGDEVLPIVKELDFPVVGVVEVNSVEQITYVKPVSYLTTASAVGATSLVLDDTSSFGSTGTVILNPGSGDEEEVNFSANNTVTNTLTVTAITTAQKVNTVVVCHTQLVLARPITGSYTSGQAVDLYDPPHSGTEVVVGDHNQEVSTWEGPYVYNLTNPAPTGATTAPTTLGEIIPGKLDLALTAGVGNTAIEVEDAMPMLGFTNIDVEVGVGKGVSETVDVQEISLRNRTSTTLSAGVTAGDTLIPATSFGPGGANGNNFPNAVGYRIVVDEAGSPEVFYVVGRSGSNFVVESPATSNHSIGATVRLVRDVIRLGTALSKSHVGKVDYGDRSTAVESSSGRAYFPVENPNYEIIGPLLPNITLTSATGLDVSGGRVLLNFGYSKILAETTYASDTTTTLTVADGSVFPSSGPFIVTVGKGRRFSEKVLVTSRAGNVLTLGGGTYGLAFSHSVGDIVSFEPGDPETVTYSEISVNDLSFDIPIMLNYTHYPVEPVVDSSVDSEPRDTGYDFPLRLPDNILTRLQYLLDAIRAAGIQVVLISKR